MCGRKYQQLKVIENVCQTLEMVFTEQKKRKIMNYTREQAEAVLKDWFDCPSILAEDFLNEKFKPQIEVGKWYKSQTNYKILVLETPENQSFKGCIVADTNYWLGVKNKILTAGLTPMTEDEVFEMLTKEAIKRGYKDGNYKCLESHEETFKLGEDSLIDVRYDGSVWFCSEKGTNKIFDGTTGEWAQIICPIDE